MPKARSSGLVLVSGVVLLATCAPGMAQVATESSLIGTWEIKGTDTEGTQWTGAMELVAKPNGAIAGHIDWTGTGGKYDGASGREIVSATYDEQTRAVSLEGKRLEKAQGISLGGYVAQLSADGNRMVKGQWSADDEPGGWRAHRVTQGAPTAPAAPKRGIQKTGFVSKTFTTPDGTESNYWLFVPHNYNKVENVPVILFLHGSGETKGEANDNQLLNVGIGPLIKAREKTFPFLTIIPQAEEKVWRKEPNAAIALGILDQTLAEYKTDAERIYLTGMSMGGTGTWDYAIAEPDRWAAIVPICGRTKPDQAATIKHIPCWVFHGVADPIINVSESRQMVNALGKAGGKPIYTEYPNAKHDCWDQAYATPGLWKWLANQKLSK